MITERDLQGAIAECEGKRNPDANTCLKLAAFYTIKQHMFPETEPKAQYAVTEAQTHVRDVMQSHSYAASPDKIGHIGDSEFAKVVENMYVDDVMDVMDELMITIQAIYPRLYNGVMRKLLDK